MNLRAKTAPRACEDGSEDPPRERAVDVIIFGGGPAGTATAIALANFGWSVTILERSHYESTRVGETLPPEVKGALNTLGLWERFLADDPVESPGITSAWGQAELYDNDFIVNPHGPGWHVDRRRFDSMLACAAEARGVEVLRGARGTSLSHVVQCESDDKASSAIDWTAAPALGPGLGAGLMALPSTGPQLSLAQTKPCPPESIVKALSAVWRVGTIVAARRLERRATLLVDATGRSASPARHLAGHRTVYDRLVGLMGFVSGSRHSTDRRTVIEAVEYGWWYSVPLPDGRRVGAFMTDADLLPAGQAARASLWQDKLDQSRHTRARIGDGVLETSPRVVLASSSRSPIVAADEWVAVGDTAAAFDPLSSQGVTWALESGLMAAAAIHHHLRGHPSAFLRYAQAVDSAFVHYLATRAHYYDRERRWPNSPFWRRRHASVLKRRWPSLRESSEKSKESRKGNCSQSYLNQIDGSSCQLDR